MIPAVGQGHRLPLVPARQEKGAKCSAPEPTQMVTTSD